MMNVINYILVCKIIFYCFSSFFLAFICRKYKIFHHKKN